MQLRLYWWTSPTLHNRMLDICEGKALETSWQAQQGPSLQAPSNSTNCTCHFLQPPTPQGPTPRQRPPPNQLRCPSRLSLARTASASTATLFPPQLPSTSPTCSSHHPPCHLQVSHHSHFHQHHQCDQHHSSKHLKHKNQKKRMQMKLFCVCLSCEMCVSCEKFVDYF